MPTAKTINRDRALTYGSGALLVVCAAADTVGFLLYTPLPQPIRLWLLSLGIGSAILAVLIKLFRVEHQGARSDVEKMTPEQLEEVIKLALQSPEAATAMRLAFAPQVYALGDFIMARENQRQR